MLRLLWAVLLLLPAGEGEDVFRALETGQIEVLRKYDTAKLLDIIRKGRPVPSGKTGEFTEKITDAFDRTTEVIFRVPKTYSPDRPAGVLVVLHGLGGNSRQLKELYPKFAESHNLILVLPTAQPEPEGHENEDSTPMMSRNVPHWWSYRDGNFSFTALSLLKKRYAIDENRVFLSGYSMGGFGTWNIGLRFPDRFAAIVPFAGGISRREYLDRSGDTHLRPLVGNAYTLPVYFMHGDKDLLVPVEFDRMTRDRLRELNFDHTYIEVPNGGHLLQVREGSDLMDPVQKWLKGRKRSAHPKKIGHFFAGDYCPQAYWVRLTEFSGETASVKAEIARQTIEFTSKGASKITFYVDETLLDLSKPITVTREGKKLFGARVEPSLEVILETWKSREDRDLLFRAKITVEVE